MQFTNTILFAAAALASMVGAENIVKFVNQDNIPKTVVFTANAGLAVLPPLKLDALKTVPQTFPQGWTGNWYTYNVGTQNKPGMLGEVNFQGWEGQTYYDVSAIVNPNDSLGVKKIYPTEQESRRVKSFSTAFSTTSSGCQTSGSAPCPNQYNNPPEVQTKTTFSTKLTCLVGNLSPAGAQRRHARDFVEA